MRYRERIQALPGEPEAWAARTDGAHEHNRYAMSLYNLTWRPEERGVAHMPVWDRLYAYMTAHTVGDELADLVANMEAELAGKAGDAGRDEIERETVLRPVKAGLNMATDCGNAGDVESAEKFYWETARFASPFSEDAEIANRLVTAAFNLCLDLDRSGAKQPKPALFFRPKRPDNAARIRAIYASVKEARPDGDAAARLAKLKNMARAVMYVGRLSDARRNSNQTDGLQ